MLTFCQISGNVYLHCERKTQLEATLKANSREHCAGKNANYCINPFYKVTSRFQTQYLQEVREAIAQNAVLRKQ